MKVRKATALDMEPILAIFAYARGVMRDSGNPNQWKNTYPSREVLLEDIEIGRLYVLEEEQIEGVFMFFVGVEPTYAHIDGEWLNDRPYGVIHRVASAGRIRGMVGRIVEYCRGVIPNLRIDTHEDNKIMQKQVEKEGFQKCGMIYLENGDPRFAYQSCVE